MNKHQLKGSAKETAGKVQKNVGKATANGTQVAKGKSRELAGKAQKSYGNAIDDVARQKAERDRQQRDAVQRTR